MKSRFWLSFSFLIASSTFLLATMSMPISGPEFSVDYVTVKNDKSSDKSRVDLYTRTPYNQLKFIGQQGQFTAQYEVSVEVYELNRQGEARRKVTSVNWDRIVKTRVFAETQNEQVVDPTTYSLELTPGLYSCQVSLTDKTSNENFLREFSLFVRDFSDPQKTITMSDVMMVNEYNPARGTVSPSVTNSIGSDHPEAMFFFEVYTKEAENLTLNYTIQQLRNTSERASVRNLEHFVLDDATKIEAVPVANWASKSLTTHAGRNPAVVSVPIKERSAGKYLINVRVLDSKGEVLDRAVKVFNIQWMGLGNYIQDLDKAIVQLRYIAKEDDLNAMRRGATSDKRMELFTDFWKKRDPSPGTKRNEAMEEYYYRIYTANKEYGQFQSGWETEQGEVFIRFGEPSFIERHPFNFGATHAYEVWYYENIGKKFVFVDYTGVGDYKLLRPIWDERNRM
jgi:GWxTD domain-containing protein